MQKRLVIAFVAICVVLMVIGLLPVHGEEEIYDTVVRLHVLANSDSEEDQALKLKVRDAVLEAAEPILTDCTTQDEAVECLREHTAVLVEAAERVIAQEGYDYPVTLTLGEEEYPRRDYDSFCFPAGTYVSLRIGIGEAEGQNWWCCLFPRLCLGAASVSTKEAEEACVSVGLLPSQYKIITESTRPVYRVRFKLLELFAR